MKKTFIRITCVCLQQRTKQKYKVRVNKQISSSNLSSAKYDFLKSTLEVSVKNSVDDWIQR